MELPCDERGKSGRGLGSWGLDMLSLGCLLDTQDEMMLTCTVVFMSVELRVEVWHA